LEQVTKRRVSPADSPNELKSNAFLGVSQYWCTLKDFVVSVELSAVDLLTVPLEHAISDNITVNMKSSLVNFVVVFKWCLTFGGMGRGG
jgi:hypothetical protein